MKALYSPQFYIFLNTPAGLGPPVGLGIVITQPTPEAPDPRPEDATFADKRSALRRVGISHRADRLLVAREPEAGYRTIPVGGLVDHGAQASAR